MTTNPNANDESRKPLKLSPEIDMFIAHNLHFASNLGHVFVMKHERVYDLIRKVQEESEARMREKIAHLEAQGKLLREVLLPPDGYHVSQVDNSVDRRCSVMFRLNKEEAEEWHLQGETLNAAGEDVRKPLYISRVTAINLHEALAQTKQSGDEQRGEGA